MMDCHGLTSLQVHPREGGGTGFIGAVGIVRERFIPARAGYGTFEELSAAKKSVHPREGGVRPKSQRGGRAVNGSSPRGRGTGSRDRRPAPPHRFIPARAGYGGKDSRILSDSSVHPREGGVRSCWRWLIKLRYSAVKDPTVLLAQISALLPMVLWQLCPGPRAVKSQRV
jgi:hypothetical protein